MQKQLKGLCLLSSRCSKRGITESGLSRSLCQFCFLLYFLHTHARTHAHTTHTHTHAHTHKHTHTHTEYPHPHAVPGPSPGTVQGVVWALGQPLLSRAGVAQINVELY